MDDGGVARIVHSPLRPLVPGEWVFSRLMVNLVRLEEKRGLVSGLVEQLRAGLMEALPDYGEHLGADGKALESHSSGEVDRKTGKCSDGDADWGHHSTRTDNILHPERGEVHCRCPGSGEIRPMAFQGFGSDRGTLKYWCPAAAYDLRYEGREACLERSGSKAGGYGRIVRIKLDQNNRRIFTPTPWGSPSWERGYCRRSALERINAQLDRVYGFEVHFILGLVKMRARVGLALAVMMALALASVAEEREERMRSLVRPFPLADTG